MSGGDFWNSDETSNFYTSSSNTNCDIQSYDFSRDMSFEEGSFVNSYSNDVTKNKYVCYDEDELSLLEELEIYPNRIIDKTLVILNPFSSQWKTKDLELLVKDADLAGPVAFCVVLAACLFISGSKAHFGYIYGLSVVSCLVMYCLLTLMTTSSEVFTISNVASTLGYCMLPVVMLSVASIFTSLGGLLGIFLVCLTIAWSTMSAARLFVAMSGDQQQKLLIAYPCLLVYAVFAVIVMF